MLNIILIFKRFVWIFWLFAGFNAICQADSLLYRIEHPGSRPSYLFGTMHSEDPRILAAAEKVMPQLEQAEKLILELDMNFTTITQASAAMFLPQNQTLKSMISAQHYQQAVELAKDYGLPEPVVNRFKPWALAITLSLPKPQGGVALDMLLYIQAQDLGIPTAGIETVDEQLGLFDQLSNADQIKFLVLTLDEHGKYQALLEQMTRVYQQGDLTQVAKLANEQQMSNDPLLEKQLEEQLLHRRNGIMFNRLQGPIQKGGAFIAVGALHLVGETGLLEAFRNAGYQVSEIPWEL